MINPNKALNEFHCPHCEVYSHQDWGNLFITGIGEIPNFPASRCIHCRLCAIWVGDKMEYPKKIIVDPPNSDLDKEIKDDYNEAAQIINLSPRGSAALLRLAIQKLCVQLGYSGENINNDIGKMVENGLSKTLQQALDLVRVIGNNAVHPGELNLKDDIETAMNLFKIINFIAQSMISTPKNIDGLYNSIIPQKAKDAIIKRDL